MRYLITLLVVCPSLSVAVAQDAKPASKPAKDTKEATDKMITSGMVTGRLLNWGSDKKEKETVTLEVSVDIADPAGLQTQARLENQLAQVSANRSLNAADRIRQTTDINRQMAQNQPHLVKQEKFKMDFRLGDNFSVRRAELPTKTEGGKVVKYTEKEKKELKGSNSKLPGYTANEEELKSGQLITAYLSKKKEAKGTSKDKSQAPPVITMILIQKEPTK
ncbi:MAG: hypothetical protein ACJ8FY_07170 [Gemmataceae bacterium]